MRLREIQRDLYTFYTRVYCEFIVIVENIGSAEGTFSTPLGECARAKRLKPLSASPITSAKVMPTKKKSLPGNNFA